MLAALVIAALVSMQPGTLAADTASVDVELEVEQVSVLDLTACPDAALAMTSVLPDQITYSDPCTIEFGSNGVSQQLRIRQTDGAGVAMFKWTTGDVDADWGAGAIPSVSTISGAPIGGTAFAMSDTAALADGSILRGGDQGQSMHIVKLTPDGELDLTYGESDGVATYAPDPGRNFHLHKLEPLPDGSVVGIGHTLGTPPRYKSHIVKFDADGKLDTSWGDGGQKAIQIDSGAYEEPYGIRAQPDGSLIIGGVVLWSDGFLLKLTEYGQPDPDFGVTGTGFTQFSGVNRYGGHVVVDGISGEIYWIGQHSANEEIVVRKFTADGTPITTGWGTAGVARIDVGFPDSQFLPSEGFLDSQGRLVTTTHAWGTYPNRGFRVLRFTTSGTQDLLTPVQHPFGTRYADLDLLSIIRTDGDRFCAGGSGQPVNATWRNFVACFTSEGALDPAFGTNGIFVSNGMVGGNTEGGGLTSVDGALYLGSGDGGTFYTTKIGGDDEQIPDYDDGVNDFDAATGAFGVCLESADHPQWLEAPSNDCSGSGTHWHGIEPTSRHYSTRLASNAAGIANATLRFGLRPPEDAIGRYLAPVTFELVAYVSL